MQYINLIWRVWVQLYKGKKMIKQDKWMSKTPKNGFKNGIFSKMQNINFKVCIWKIMFFSCLVMYLIPKISHFIWENISIFEKNTTTWNISYSSILDTICTLYIQISHTRQYSIILWFLEETMENSDYFSFLG